MTKTYLGRKIGNLEELKADTAVALKKGYETQEVVIIRNVELEAPDFEAFTANFLKDQAWIGDHEGGVDKDGRAHCLKVINKKTGDVILVDPEGYEYPRYVGLEIK